MRVDSSLLKNKKNCFNGLKVTSKQKKKKKIETKKLNKNIKINLKDPKKSVEKPKKLKSAP